MFFVATGVNSESPENLNIVYVTNIVKEPVYLEKMVVVTNVIEKAIGNKEIKPIYNKTIPKKYSNDYEPSQTEANIISFFFMGLWFLFIGVLLIEALRNETFGRKK